MKLWFWIALRWILLRSGLGHALEIDHSPSLMFSFALGGPKPCPCKSCPKGPHGR